MKAGRMTSRSPSLIPTSQHDHDARRGTIQTKFEPTRSHSIQHLDEAASCLERLKSIMLSASNGFKNPDNDRNRRRTIEHVLPPITNGPRPITELCSWSEIKDLKTASLTLRGDIERKIQTLREKEELQEVFDKHCAKVRNSRAKAQQQTRRVSESVELLLPRDRAARCRQLSLVHDERMSIAVQRRDSNLEEFYKELMEAGLEEDAAMHHDRLLAQRWARIACAVRFLSIVHQAITRSKRKDRVVRVVTFLQAALTKQERNKNRWKLLLIGTQLRVLLQISRKRLSTNIIRNALRKYRRTSLFTQAIRLFFSRVKRCQRIAKAFASCRKARRDMLQLQGDVCFAKCKELLLQHFDPSGALRRSDISPTAARRLTASVVTPRKLSLLPALTPRKLSLAPSTTPRKLSLLSPQQLASSTPRKLSTSAVPHNISPDASPLASARRTSKQPTALSEMPNQVWRPLLEKKKKLQDTTAVASSKSQQNPNAAESPKIAPPSSSALPLVQLVEQAQLSDVVGPNLINTWFHYVCLHNQAMDMQFRLQLRCHYFDCRTAQIHRERGNHFMVMPPRPLRPITMCVVSAELAVADILDEFRALLKPIAGADNFSLPPLTESQKVARALRQDRLAEAGKIFATHSALEVKVEDEVEPIEFPSVRVVKEVQELRLAKGKVVRYHVKL